MTSDPYPRKMSPLVVYDRGEIMSAEVAEVLREAYELIKDREHWTQGCAARTIEDHPCEALDPDAFSFCAVGAVQRTVDRAGDDFDGWLFSEAMEFVGGEDPIVILNDEQGHTAVLRAFKKAIELAGPVEARELVLA